jgi:hypothetical protein
MALADDQSDASVLTKFAIHHLMAASGFARECHQIEFENGRDAFTRHYRKIYANVTAGVLLSVAAMEANLNEYVAEQADLYRRASQIDAIKSLLSNDQIDFVWRDAGPTLDRYQRLLKHLGHHPMPDGDVYQNAIALIAVRNGLVHFHAEWDTDQHRHVSINERLAGKFQPNEHCHPNGPLFPQRFICHAGVAWAVQSSLNFMRAYSTHSGLKFKFDERPERVYKTTFHAT